MPRCYYENDQRSIGSAGKWGGATCSRITMRNLDGFVNAKIVMSFSIFGREEIFLRVLIITCLIKIIYVYRKKRIKFLFSYKFIQVFCDKHHKYEIIFKIFFYGIITCYVSSLKCSIQLDTKELSKIYLYFIKNNPPLFLKHCIQPDKT